jgi:hypothetical protein
MAAKGKHRRTRAAKIKYVVSTSGSAPADLEEKISDAHALALLAERVHMPSNHEEAKLSDAKRQIS